MALALGLDTSNYTTSLAYFDGKTGKNVSRLLDVPEGTLGLRQSDALFQHVKRLPSLMEQLCGGQMLPLAAVGASTRPRAVADSYMPCFLAGESQGRSIASLLSVPFFAVSHQQGHIAAGAWSAGRMDLLDKPHLSWHLSGGTTELLYIEPEGALVKATKIGGTQDISAGQLIDRTGKRLGLAFPAGKALDALSLDSSKTDCFKVKHKAGYFSLSGLENKMNALAEAGTSGADIATFILQSLYVALQQASAYAKSLYPDLPLLCVGGVASNQLLRQGFCRDFDACFAEAQFSTDNAMGTAIFAHRLLMKTENK